MASAQKPVVESLRQLLFARRQFVTEQATAIATARARWTWAVLERLVERAVEQLSSLTAQRVGVAHQGDGLCWAALIALDELRADVFLLNPMLGPEEHERLATEFQLAAVVSSDGQHGIHVRHLENAAAGSGQSSVTILTSGTSGRPKAVRHNWATLSRPVRRSAGVEAVVWLQSYLPNLYAGVQVALQSLVNGGTLVCPDGDADVDAIIGLMLRERVQFASATPSYWRRLLMFGDMKTLRQVPLKQISLGGEMVDQQVLDLLKDAFPQARIVHIYATSELGRCFSVADGRAGFPTTLVETATVDGVELKVVDHELLVRSPNAMLGYDSLGDAATQKNEWIHTGDLLRRNADRFVFVGRRSDVINVGGNKVFPQEVEPVLRAVLGVADVRVYGKQSSLVGQLVAAQVVALQTEDAEIVKARIIEAGMQHLAPHQRPRLVEMVERIEVSQAGKIVRR